MSYKLLSVTSSMQCKPTSTLGANNAHLNYKKLDFKTIQRIKLPLNWPMKKLRTIQ